ncbi:ABC transporter permease [Actinokineospora auranticolor]|uniref:Peptide/nickel transport system permease protein n=1 Tax=Actinokineospora auranticolor TaxID=155976 RepID=A0A2S6GLS2_9PSEU|nr:ABC transporter permease [Actinokineospora auranticolor]PPK66178.1 peptide/nickel transport system permease protein [Actinokineospora auranticolor]
MTAEPTARARSGFRPALWLAYLVLALVVLAAVWPSLVATHPPDAIDLGAPVAGPSPAHLFGTDVLGRDTFSRVVHGARWSLVIGLGATSLALVVGALLGVLSASGPRLLDEAIGRATDILLAFPGLLLALLVVAVLGPGALNATIAIGCSTVPGFVRLARGQALVVRESGYVRAAVVLGHSPARIHARHVLPNAVPPLLVFATVTAGTAIISGSALSFLGLGPKAPTPEWGAMLADGRDFLDTAWALAVFPGLAVTATVVAVNVVGADLRRRFEGSPADGN